MLVLLYPMDCFQKFISTDLVPFSVQTSFIFMMFLCFRYIQVGNAVAVPVARALGYALGQAIKGNIGSEALIKLPQNFPFCLQRTSSVSNEMTGTVDE